MLLVTKLNSGRKQSTLFANDDFISVALYVCRSSSWCHQYGYKSITCL